MREFATVVTSVWKRAYGNWSILSNSKLAPLRCHLEVDTDCPRSHAGHMPYIWQGALSMVSQSLLIMGATMSPSLLSILLTLVSHRDALDELINAVIAEVEHYAALAPSLSLAAEIIKEAEVRRRAYLNA